VTFLKCPWCGDEVEVEEYVKHLETCPKRRERGFVSLSTWKTKFAQALAQDIIARGHFERRDFDELAEKIEKMLDEYEKQWG
jgi:hypothetical protein